MERNMNVISVKQGYLHIKRERSAYPVASKVLFKPWQQAYFILRRDPFVIEEYKDASLKTPKQHHFVGTIKHVGLVRTSKSQQYAFEVVVKEDTALLFGCENQMLREEWINAFTEVMNAATDMRRKHSPGASAQAQQHPLLERKGSLNDTYRVMIVETSLTKSNELCGEYFISMTPVRMSLLSITDLNEVLSWPINNITYYTHQPHVNQVILIMSRTCHFGSGKLIFESKQNELLIRCIEVHHTRNRNAESSRFPSRSSSINSMNSSLGSFTERSPLRLSCDEDPPVFESPHSTMKSILEDDTKLHSKLQRNSVIETVDSKPSPTVTKKSVEQEPSLNDFAVITNEERYVLPNEPVVNFLLERKNSRFSNRESPTRSTNSSDNETEMSSYLQIVDGEEAGDDPEAKRMLEALNSSLTDPLNNPGFISSLNDIKQTGCQSPKIKVEKRRSSEPPKLMMSNKLTERDSDKKSGKKAVSVDSASFDQVRSPLLARFSTKNNAFPKQHSISQGNHDSVAKSMKSSINPFDKLEEFFMNHSRSNIATSRSLHELALSSRNYGLRRNFTEAILSTGTNCPELDRNTKPKNIGSKIFEVPEFTLEQNGEDPPPPIPERTSPKPFKNISSKKRLLERSQVVDDEDIDSTSSKESIAKETEDQQNVEYDPRNSIAAPPLPPKAKILTPTQSAPLPLAHEIENGECDEDDPFFRSSSLGARPKSELYTEDDSECDLGSSNDDEEDVAPPEVPCRVPLNNIARQQHLSTSEGNLLKANLWIHQKQLIENINNNNTITQSVEQLNKKTERRTIQNELNAHAPICDDGILSECPMKPKSSSRPSGFFSKPTKPSKTFSKK